MNKSNLGIAAVALDLTRQGWVVCTPLSEHAWFDLVAVSGTTTLTIQCKYRSVVDGKVEVAVNNYRNDSSGNVAHKHLPVDYYAVTDGDSVAYVPYEEVCDLKGSFSLRVEPPKNHQQQNIRLFEDYKIMGV